jgi:hypothetical protein
MNKFIKSPAQIIKDYANVYKEFESLQSGASPIFSNGDQKTGVIAEYYAKCHIEKNITNLESVNYAETGASHDIDYKLNGSKKTIKVQVKGVSAHSKTRIIAPLNLKKLNNENPFDQLYLICLDEDFKLQALYITTYDSIMERLKQQGDKRERIYSSIMRGNSIKSGEKNGSVIYGFDDNRII